MCDKSFTGILNSAVCPEDLKHEGVDPHDFEVVIAYAQHAFFVNNEYDAQADRYANISPAKYKEVMNRAMDIIERHMMTAFEQASAEIANACNEKG